MTDSIYKINKLEYNNSQSQFCLSYNDGIKAFNTEDFKEMYSCNTLGAISLGVLFRELNLAIFVGTENNELYNNKKVCIYDLINKKLVYSTSFLNEIISLKTIDKYLIIGFPGELKIFSLEKSDTIIPVKEISLPESDIYEIWEKKSDNDILSLTEIDLAYLFQKEICINSFIGNDWSNSKKLDVKNPVEKGQNLFYVEKINQIIMPDETARYIYGFDADTGKQVLVLYRGEKPGIITSVTLLNKNYLAINNINRNIYIYDLSSSQGIKMLDKFYSLFYGNYIKPIIKIPHNKLVKNKEGEFYESDFQKKGAILSGEEEGINLKVVAYNGFAFKIKVGFFKNDFEVVIKEKIAEYKDDQDKEYNLSSSNTDENLYSSYNSIFDKEKKKQNKTEKDDA
jgi:hypothetical protein